MALVFLGSSDKEKYALLMIGLSAQFSLKNDQYPKTITKSTYVPSNHCLDNGGKNNARLDSEGRNINNSTSQNSSPGKNLELSFAQLQGQCYCCGKPGHKFPVCRKDKPKSEWHITQVKEAEQHNYLSMAESVASHPCQQGNIDGEITNAQVDILFLQTDAIWTWSSSIVSPPRVSFAKERWSQTSD